MKEIIKIREAIWNMFPNICGFDIIDYRRTNESAIGRFRVNLMSGHTKVLQIEYESKNDSLKINEEMPKEDK